MNEAKLFKEEYNDWSKLYHKTLKGLEVMIDVQKQVQDMIKIAEEANTTITEMKETILKCYKTRVWTDFGRVRVRTEIGQ